MADQQPATEPVPAPEAAAPEAAASDASPLVPAQPVPALEHTLTTEISEPPAPEPHAEEAEPTARRPRTVRLLVGALVLGPLLGGSLGYAIQAARPQTPLPRLQVAVPQYPTTVLDPKAVAEAAPKPLNIDGDLRKLLISKPDGAEDWDNYGHGDTSGWISVGERAMTRGKAGSEFSYLLNQGFRRDAITTWSKGDTHYRVELIQYDATHVSSAVNSVQVYMGTEAHPLEGTADGYYSAPDKALTYAESTEKYYYGEARARRGDVVMQISVFSPNQVNADELKDIAKRQWERLV